MEMDAKRRYQRRITKSGAHSSVVHIPQNSLKTSENVTLHLANVTGMKKAMEVTV